MADDIIEQISPHIREILRIVRDVRGRRLRELNELVGQTSKLESFIFLRMYTLRLSLFKIIMSRWTEKQVFLARFILNLNASADLVD
jgi:hypothetical protein